MADRESGLSFLATFVAPGWLSMREGSYLDSLAGFLLNCLGVTGGILLAVWGKLFLPVVLLLWIVYQVLLSFRSSRSRIARAAGTPQSTLSRSVRIAGILLLASPVVVGIAVIWSCVAVAQLPFEHAAASPTARPGEWITYERLEDVRLFARGELAVVRCTDGGTIQIARVMGLAGEEIVLHHGEVCADGTCFPQTRFAQFPEPAGIATVLVEVIGERYHLLFRTSSGEEEARGAAPVRIRLEEGQVALLPDNRDGTGLDSCTGSLKAGLEEILGKPRYILFSSDFGRIGVDLK